MKMSRPIRLIFAALLLTAACCGQTFNGVLTWHNDNARTGQNLNETVLTPQNVNSSSFGKVLSYPVDGAAYAQPLYVPNVQIKGRFYNVVYIATENNSVAAFDASNLRPLWHATFSDPLNNVVPVNCTTARLSCNVYPIDGVTATPVIDISTNTMYVVAHTLETDSYFVKLHA